MDHQDFIPIIIGKSPKNMLGTKKIVPKNTMDMQKIKIENETENFSVKKIPSGLSKEISNARNLNKITQKDASNKLNIPVNVFMELENGKAIYDGKTKQIIQRISKLFGVKFEKYN